jgi:uncharacterized protein (TIGR00297 family)
VTAAVASALSDPSARTIIGAVAAAAIAGAAWKARALTANGAIAAVIVGSACAAAGWGWAAMLIAFFLTSTGLGRIGRDRRALRTGGIVAKGGARDARQVLANGGAFALAALAWLVAPSPTWLAVGGGALAAAASDTWATEIGSLARGSPRHVITWQQVPTGTSGAVSIPGTLASVAGALLIGVLAAISGWPRLVILATVVGGIAGSAADSLLGGTLQVRRWCDRCDSGTEQSVHLCGSRTRVAGGIPWVDNDMVNLASILIGAATAALLIAAR